jgi:hypothetical protein
MLSIDMSIFLDGAPASPGFINNMKCRIKFQQLRKSSMYQESTVHDPSLVDSRQSPESRVQPELTP